MTIVFYFFSFVAVVAALASIRLRNLVHAVISLMLFFFALAAIFILLLAEFIGAVQILVYVGAVGILLLFAIMLTRHISGQPGERIDSRHSLWGLLAAAAFLLLFLLPTLQSIPHLLEPPFANFDPSVKSLGQLLLWPYAPALEVVALLLTAALLGAVAVAMEETEKNSKSL